MKHAVSQTHSQSKLPKLPPLQLHELHDPPQPKPPPQPPNGLPMPPSRPPPPPISLPAKKPAAAPPARPVTQISHNISLAWVNNFGHKTVVFKKHRKQSVHKCHEISKSNEKNIG